MNVYSNKTVIPRSAFDTITAAHAIVTRKAYSPMGLSAYGMGWFRTSYFGYEVIHEEDTRDCELIKSQVVSHSGGLPGVVTEVLFFPSDGLGIVLLLNGGDKSQLVDNVVKRIVDNIFVLTTGSKMLAAHTVYFNSNR